MIWSNTLSRQPC